MLQLKTVSEFGPYSGNRKSMTGFHVNFGKIVRRALKKFFILFLLPTHKSIKMDNFHQNQRFHTDTLFHDTFVLGLHIPKKQLLYFLLLPLQHAIVCNSSNVKIPTIHNYYFIRLFQQHLLLYFTCSL